MKKKGLIFVGVLGLAAQPASADLLGLADGRSANLDNQAGLSVEGGITVGDDFNFYGARVNYKVTPDILVFGEVGLLDPDFFDSGAGFGVGAFYQLRSINVLENTDLGLKAAFHAASVDTDGFGGNQDIDLTEFVVEVLLSGDKLLTTNLGWYANTGLHFIGVDLGAFGDDDDTEFGIGGGVTGNLSVGEWYAGAETIDGLIFSAGYRYNLN